MLLVRPDVLFCALMLATPNTPESTHMKRHELEQLNATRDETRKLKQETEDLRQQIGILKPAYYGKVYGQPLPSAYEVFAFDVAGQK